ncbi:MAG: Inorganic diphosphatase [Myxococcaceae bacterium]|nr:Inorganic diphosphatase [Myxococcaceae bacterium]
MRLTQTFRVMVETPRGAQLKLKYDPEQKAMTLSRPLPMGCVYPFDFGFVPGTKADDGDPLDALVYWDLPAVPGLLLECRPLGVVELTQHSKKKNARERNDRLIAVPIKAERQKDLSHVHDLSPRVRAEIEQFFISSVYFSTKAPKIIGWRGPAEALKILARAVRDGT